MRSTSSVNILAASQQALEDAGSYSEDTLWGAKLKTPRLDNFISRLQTTAAKCAQQIGVPEEAACTALSQQLLDKATCISVAHGVFEDHRGKVLEMLRIPLTDDRLHVLSKMRPVLFAGIMSTVIAAAVGRFSPGSPRGVQDAASILQGLCGEAGIKNAALSLRFFPGGVHAKPGQAVQVHGVLHLLETVLEKCDPKAFCEIFARWLELNVLRLSRAVNAFPADTPGHPDGWCAHAYIDLRFAYIAYELLRIDERRIGKGRELVDLCIALQATKTKISTRLRAFKQQAHRVHTGRQAWSLLGNAKTKQTSVQAVCKDAIEMWQEVSECGWR